MGGLRCQGFIQAQFIADAFRKSEAAATNREAQDKRRSVPGMNRAHDPFHRRTVSRFHDPRAAVTTGTQTQQ